MDGIIIINTRLNVLKKYSDQDHILSSNKIKDLQKDGSWDKLDDGIKKLLISQTFNCDTLF